MIARYEAELYPTLDIQQAFGVIDHKTFRWAKGADGRDLRFATREEAQAWIKPRQGCLDETAASRS